MGIKCVQNDLIISAFKSKVKINHKFYFIQIIYTDYTG